MQPILIAAPTASAKNYIFDKWVINARNFTYPDTQIILFDNTLDNGANAKYLNKRYRQLFGHNEGFLAIHSQIKSNSVIERMAYGHNQCVEKAKELGCKYLFHLETDILPPADIIERLLFHNKPIVGALYYRDEGLHRRPMIQVPIVKAPRILESANMLEGIDTTFVDGTLKRVSHVGIGATLIHLSVFNNIKFRFEKGEALHPDAHFANDCIRNNIPIYCDTSIVCQHHNRDWGTFGVDYN